MPWGDTVLTCLPGIGVAVQTGPPYAADTLMRAPDEAMYRAEKARSHVSIIDCPEPGAVPIRRA